MKFLRITLRQPPEMRHPMQEFLRETTAVDREEMWAWTMSQEEFDRLLFYVVGEIEPYRAALEDVDSITSWDLTPAGDGGFYVYLNQRTPAAEQSFRGAFEGHDLVIVPPVVFDAEGQMRLTLVGPPDALQGVLEDFPDAILVDVERIGEYDHRHDALAGALTDRQRQAVRVAVEAGYYAVPREASLSEVADDLEVAEGTASNLLRRAEAAVMERALQAGGPL